MHAMDMIRGENFWRDGCRMMAIAIYETLRLAGEEGTAENVIKFVLSLPRNRAELATEAWRKEYCCACLEKMHRSNAPEKDRYLLADYLITFFPDRNWWCQETLIDSFVGIYQVIEEETIRRKEEANSH